MIRIPKNHVFLGVGFLSCLQISLQNPHLKTFGMKGLCLVSFAQLGAAVPVLHNGAVTAGRIQSGCSQDQAWQGLRQVVARFGDLNLKLEACHMYLYIIQITRSGHFSHFPASWKNTSRICAAVCPRRSVCRTPCKMPDNNWSVPWSSRRAVFERCQVQ